LRLQARCCSFAREPHACRQRQATSFH